MRLGYGSIARSTLVAATMSLLLAACGGGDGSNSTDTALAPSEMSQTPTASVSATLSAHTIVGEWKSEPTCQVLVRALTQAGLRDFAAEWVGGAVLLTTPENVHAEDPKHPCADAAGPVHYSSAFWEDGTYNAYNPDGQEMDAGEYEIVDRNTILFAGLHVGYKIDGDTVVFSFSPPESCTSGCRRRAAYAISFFYPGMTWERVS